MVRKEVKELAKNKGPCTMPTPWDLGKRVDDFLFTQQKKFASASGKRLVRISQTLKKGGEKLSGKRLRNGAKVCQDSRSYRLCREYISHLVLDMAHHEVYICIKF